MSSRLSHKTLDSTERQGSGLNPILQNTKVISPFLGLNSESMCLVFSPLPLFLFSSLSFFFPPSPSPPLIFYASHLPTPCSHPVSSYLLEIHFFSCLLKFSFHVVIAETTGGFAPKKSNKKGRKEDSLEDRTQCFKSCTQCCFFNCLILSPGRINGQEQFCTSFSGIIKVMFSFHHPQTYTCEIELCES